MLCALYMIYIIIDDSFSLILSIYIVKNYVRKTYNDTVLSTSNYYLMV